MRAFFTAIFFIVFFHSQAQQLTIHTYGNSRAMPLIFLHGGPGSNAISFEHTCAEQIASLGYFVITYDRRGEGRSADEHAAYTFKQSFEDLNDIYRRYKIKKATLIGFSFGGIVSTLYASQYPQKVQSLVLVSSLISLQETYNTIIRSSTAIYQSRQDAAALRDLAELQQLDHFSLEFRKGCFRHATANGFFATPHRNLHAQYLYRQLDGDSLYQHYNAIKTNQPADEFWKHEHYTKIDLTDRLKQLKAGGVKIYAMYGKDDGLYSNEQVMAVKNITGEDHFYYLPDASHYLYIDQQARFIEALKIWKPQRKIYPTF